jgi:hypothetical protein
VRCSVRAIVVAELLEERLMVAGDAPIREARPSRPLLVTIALRADVVVGQACGAWVIPDAAGGSRPTHTGVVRACEA